MKNNYKIMKVVFAVSLAAFIIACGGGGGGGGGKSSNSISYTGSINQAVITNANADDIATGAYQGGVTGTSLGIGAVSTGHNGPIRPRTVSLSQAIENSFRKFDITSGSSNISSGAIQSKSDTIIGDCGGSGSYTIRVDDVSGDFSGKVTYSSYCEEGVEISGSMNFTGEADVYTGDILSLNCTLSNLAAISGSDSFTLQGDIDFDFIGSSATVIYDALLRDNSTLKVYRIDDFNMTLSEGVDYLEVTVYGRYYDPDYGYTVVSTSSPLRFSSGDEWPSEGVLVCSGNTGIAGGNTIAQLTVVSSTNYQVVADTNGDGLYDDYNSGSLLWADL